MQFSNQGRLHRQVRFLRRQFLQDGDLPFTDVLSEKIVSQALAAAGVVWNDSIYHPLVLLGHLLFISYRSYPLPGGCVDDGSLGIGLGWNVVR